MKSVSDPFFAPKAHFAQHFLARFSRVFRCKKGSPTVLIFRLNRSGCFQKLNPKFNPESRTLKIHPPDFISPNPNLKFHIPEFKILLANLVSDPEP